MAEYPLLDSVRKFIAAHITAVEQLEILVLVSEEPERSWSAESVFKVVQSSRDSVARRMREFVSAGLFVADESNPLNYRFQPGSPEDKKVVADLKHAYSVSRVRVIEAIYSGPGSSAKQFAHSFRFKKNR